MLTAMKHRTFLSF